MNLFFFYPEIDCFFSEIGNTLMRVLARKKTHVFFGSARPKCNARAHLKQRKKQSGLRPSKNTGIKYDITTTEPGMGS